MSVQPQVYYYTIAHTRIGNIWFIKNDCNKNKRLTLTLNHLVYLTILFKSFILYKRERNVLTVCMHTCHIPKEITSYNTNNTVSPNRYLLIHSSQSLVRGIQKYRFYELVHVYIRIHISMRSYVIMSFTYMCMHRP